jgi:hypothetical protein
MKVCCVLKLKQSECRVQLPRRLDKNFTPKVHFWPQGYRQFKSFLYLVNHWSQFSHQPSAFNRQNDKDSCLNRLLSLSPSPPRGVFVLTCVSVSLSARVLSLSPLPASHNCLSLSVYLFIFLSLFLSFCHCYFCQVQTITAILTLNKHKLG